MNTLKQIDSRFSSDIGRYIAARARHDYMRSNLIARKYSIPSDLYLSSAVPLVLHDKNTGISLAFSEKYQVVTEADVRTFSRDIFSLSTVFDVTQFLPVYQSSSVNLYKVSFNDNAIFGFRKKIGEDEHICAVAILQIGRRILYKGCRIEPFVDYPVYTSEQLTLNQLILSLTTEM
ncbi:hypothetical protein [Reinekea sp. G2M2-21]|uniref:hypothetical protein n=1 Tax=Reinekea sp. G2M2-21 TaxID=2788942 RepID=UPI0018A92C4A|nr:hypothetical protein [Reinekea sp. G2M2-21]